MSVYLVMMKPLSHHMQPDDGQLVVGDAYALYLVALTNDESLAAKEETLMHHEHLRMSGRS